VTNMVACGKAVNGPEVVFQPDLKGTFGSTKMGLIVFFSPVNINSLVFQFSIWHTNLGFLSCFPFLCFFLTFLLASLFLAGFDAPL